MKVMIKDLAQKQAERNHTKQAEEESRIKSLVSVIREELLKGNAVWLTGLGTIYPFKAKARNYRAPKSGELKALNPRIRLKIKSAEGFVRALNAE